MTPAPRLLLSTLLIASVAGLAACGGNDSGAAAPSSSAAAPSTTSVPASPTPSAFSSQDAQTIGIEAQGVGLDVAAWYVKHDFTDPADDAEFQKKISYQHSLSEGEKATYRKVAAKRFEVCVTKYDGATALGWGIYRSDPGDYVYGVGSPTEAFCP